jgi:hypothetical protein
MHRLTQQRTALVAGPLTPWLLYAAGTAARLALAVLTGRFGYTGDVATAFTSATGYEEPLSLGALCCPFAVAVAALRAFRQQARGARLALAVLFAAEVAASAASGQKAGFVTTVLAVAIPWASARRKIPTALIAAALLFFLAVIVPFSLAYRSSVRSDTGSLSSSQALSDAPSIAGGALAGAVSPQLLWQSVGFLAQRVREIDAPAIIMQRTPAQIPYASPAQLPAALAADMIPRALWPGKPVNASGYQFSQEYYETPSQIYSSPAITPWGDLYRHGGWAPVIAGMLVLGGLFRVLDDVLDVRSDPAAGLLVLALFPALVMAEKDWVSTLAGIPPIFAAWLLVTAVIFRRRLAKLTGG